jgi:hypothetical protein
MKKMHVVPLAFAGLVGLTTLTGAVVLALTLDSDPGVQTSRAWMPTYVGTASYAGKPAPAHLVGKWSSSRLSSINYRDRTTGTFAPPSGSIFTYAISADGTYEYSGYMQSSMYSCTIVVFRWQRGTLTATGGAADGQRLTFTPREGKLHYKDSCRAGSEKEKTVVDEPASYTVAIETEGAHQVLVMKKPNGEDWGKFYKK